MYGRIRLLILHSDIHTLVLLLDFFPYCEGMQPGAGCITLSLHGARAVFSELSSTYPLKLLSPYVHDGTAIVYLLTYGGGLVGGDEVDLTVNVQPGVQLVMLSQVSVR